MLWLAFRYLKSATLRHWFVIIIVPNLSISNLFALLTYWSIFHRDVLLMTRSNHMSYNGFGNEVNYSSQNLIGRWSYIERCNLFSTCQVLEIAEYIGSGFIYKGIQPSNTSRIGIYSQNTPEVGWKCGV